mmetsp:Transcript_16875/g.20310  ORF Transcript_16875/g.20310 Transcript_16875/m.20310 type:complete len:933 (+) Transcript_16875:111-2909(+)|eukprot:CAMPEP_0197851336 /NCGR_PEP_ID=MMETSP1438-20131217/17844_1 /TAXON_ID=1461541 /ORGANISM="Pterosperma sp., Strain CCMP1384" /LENGTH=932 /DNA_ID=CAMNT_0043464907 /DNA_START=106 /DNA_END=2904 /DNA_ORIENTATION=+
MASGLDNGERGRIDQIIWEFFVKSTHTVLESRTPGQNLETQKTRPNRWFNLDIEEAETVRALVEPWRKDNSLPLVIEVYLEQKKTGSESKQREEGGEVESTLIEQWVLQYEKNTKDQSTWGAMSGGGGSPVTNTVFSRRTSASVQLERPPDIPVIYKRTVILLRSLYSLLRLLPGHRLHRACKRNQCTDAVLKCRTLLPGDAVAAIQNVSASSDQSFTSFQLTPVATPGGKLCAGVTYRQHTLVAQHIEATPPPLPRIICNYVNSPTGPKWSRSQTVSNPSGVSAASAKGVASVQERRGTWNPTGSSSPALPRSHRSQSAAGPQGAFTPTQKADQQDAKGGIQSAWGKAQETPESKSSSGGNPSLSVGSDGMTRMSSAPVSIPRSKAQGTPRHPESNASGSTSNYSNYSNYSNNSISPNTGPGHWPEKQIVGFHPASAPSAVNMMSNPAASAMRGNYIQNASLPKNATLPPHPSHRRREADSGRTQRCQSTGSDSNNSGTSVSSNTISCSPNLPFAFTPKPLSNSSVIDEATFPGTNVSPPISGNAIASSSTSSAMVLARRPSWSPSSSLNAQAAAVCSISPVIIDSTPNSLVYSPPSILPNNYGYNLQPGFGGLGTMQESGNRKNKPSDMQGPLRLTFKVLVPPPSEEGEDAPPGAEDMDMLPFALEGDEDASKSASAPTPSLGAPGSLSIFGGGEAAAIAASAKGGTVDVAAGALIHMLQDAPALRPDGRPRSDSDTSGGSSRKMSDASDTDHSDKMSRRDSEEGAPGSVSSTGGVFSSLAGASPNSVGGVAMGGTDRGSEAGNLDDSTLAAKQEFECMGLPNAALVTQGSLSAALANIDRWKDIAVQLNADAASDADDLGEPECLGTFSSQMESALEHMERSSRLLESTNRLGTGRNEWSVRCGGEHGISSGLSDTSVESADETMPFIM